jgi:hypothetical protein
MQPFNQLKMKAMNKINSKAYLDTGSHTGVIRL